MAVVKTFVENGKTIRVWEESCRGKILTRMFYIQYRLMMLTTGHVDSKVFDTFSQADKASKEWMDSLGKNWVEYNEFCTHIEGTEWWCLDRGVCAKCYICEEGSEIISEVIE